MAAGIGPRAGASLMHWYGTYNTSHGVGAVVVSERGICRVFLPQPTRHAAIKLVSEEFPDAEPDRRVRGARAIRQYFQGGRLPGDVPLDLGRVPSFHREVYEMTQAIPHGETRSYKWVASCLGKSKAARAVGVALSRNPVPLLVPCHRVVASDGSLGGWSGQAGWKEKLLALEVGKGGRRDW